jgi:hypothetical protein
VGDEERSVTNWPPGLIDLTARPHRRYRDTHGPSLRAATSC